MRDGKFSFAEPTAATQAPAAGGSQQRNPLVLRLGQDLLRFRLVLNASSSRSGGRDGTPHREASPTSIDEPRQAGTSLDITLRSVRPTPPSGAAGQRQGACVNIWTAGTRRKSSLAASGVPARAV